MASPKYFNVSGAQAGRFFFCKILAYIFAGITNAKKGQVLEPIITMKNQKSFIKLAAKILNTIINAVRIALVFGVVSSSAIIN